MLSILATTSTASSCSHTSEQPASHVLERLITSDVSAQAISELRRTPPDRTGQPTHPISIRYQSTIPLTKPRANKYASYAIYYSSSSSLGSRPALATSPASRKIRPALRLAN